MNPNKKKYEIVRFRGGPLLGWRSDDFGRRSDITVYLFWWRIDWVRLHKAAS